MDLFFLELFSGTIPLEYKEDEKALLVKNAKGIIELQQPKQKQRSLDPWRYL